MSWSAPSEQPVRAVAVDLERLQVWAYSGSTLLLFGSGGELLLEASAPGPSPAEVLLEIDPRDGSVWLGGRRDLWRVSTSGEVLVEVHLEREARALGMDVEGSLLRVATGRSVLALDSDDGTVRSETDFGPKAGVASGTGARMGITSTITGHDLVRRVTRRRTIGTTMMMEITISPVKRSQRENLGLRLKIRPNFVSSTIPPVGQSLCG